MPGPTQTGMPRSLGQAREALAQVIATQVGRSQSPTGFSPVVACSTGPIGLNILHGLDLQGATTQEALRIARDAAQLLTLFGAGSAEIAKSMGSLLMSDDLPRSLAEAVQGIGVMPSRRVNVSKLEDSGRLVGVSMAGPLHTYGVTVSQGREEVPLLLQDMPLGRGALLLVGVDRQSQSPVKLVTTHTGLLAGALALTPTHRHPLSGLTFEGILARYQYQDHSFEPVAEVVKYPTATIVETKDIIIGPGNGTTQLSGILPVRLNAKGRVGTAIHVGASHEIGDVLWQDPAAQALAGALIEAGAPKDDGERTIQRLLQEIILNSKISTGPSSLEFFTQMAGGALDAFGAALAGVSIVFVEKERFPALVRSLRSTDPLDLGVVNNFAGFTPLTATASDSHQAAGLIRSLLEARRPYHLKLSELGIPAALKDLLSGIENPPPIDWSILKGPFPDINLMLTKRALMGDLERHGFLSDVESGFGDHRGQGKGGFSRGKPRVTQEEKDEILAITPDNLSWEQFTFMCRMNFFDEYCRQHPGAAKVLLRRFLNNFYLNK